MEERRRFLSRLLYLLQHLALPHTVTFCFYPLLSTGMAHGWVRPRYSAHLHTTGCMATAGGGAGTAAGVSPQAATHLHAGYMTDRAPRSTSDVSH